MASRYASQKLAPVGCEKSARIGVVITMMLYNDNEHNSNNTKNKQPIVIAIVRVRITIVIMITASLVVTSNCKRNNSNNISMNMQ